MQRMKTELVKVKFENPRRELGEGEPGLGSDEVDRTGRKRKGAQMVRRSADTIKGHSAGRKLINR